MYRKPFYSYFRPNHVIIPTLYQNWTAFLEGPARVLETLFLFQIKICDFPYPISELNCFPRGSSMCPGNLIPTSDQNMWYSLPYNYQNWTAFLEGPACVLETLFPFQIKICDFPYPISDLNCCPQESSMRPGNLIPISDQNMWFFLGSSMCPGNLIPISDQLTCTQGNIPPRVHLTYWIHF